MTDPHMVTELVLYIENTGALMNSRSQGEAIRLNLARKVASGKYSKDLAPKAWLHLVEKAAKLYATEFPGVRFSVAERRAVAEQLARAWESENNL